MLLNHKSRFLPVLRRDLQWIPVRHDNKSFLSVYDSMGYTTANLAFPIEIREILNLFNGNSTWDSLKSQGLNDSGIQEIQQIAEMLDSHGIFHSDAFLARKKQVDLEFLERGIRPTICAGTTYPLDAEKLRILLDQALASVPKSSPNGKPAALFAPHIDFKVNLQIYAKSFELLKTVKPRHVYLIGTSHYSGLWQEYENKPFQFSSKSFELPGRMLKNNETKTHAFFEKMEAFGATMLDYSHRMEHSLELHAVWASHIWRHDFTITPILIGSFEDTLYMENSALETMIANFSKILQEVSDEDSFILISGDLSHIGLKFGDDEPASSKKETVQKFDRDLLNQIARIKPKAIYEMQRLLKDEYHVCGFPPIQSVISAKPDWLGEQIGYDYWDEVQTQSAVSFGSVVFYKK